MSHLTKHSTIRKPETFTHALWIALAAAVSALGVTIFSFQAANVVEAAAARQAGSTAAQSAKFEVASIKPCKDEDFQNGQRRQELIVSPGRLRLNCIPAARIIYFAYTIGSLNKPLLNDSPSNPEHVRGGPGWLRDEMFVVEATAEGGADRDTMVGPMLRALLEERFHLKMHRAVEEIPLYALRVAKAGLKIRPIGADGCTSEEATANLSNEQRTALNNGPKPPCGNFGVGGDTANLIWSMGGATFGKFATQLSNVLDRYVVDETATPGTFNIHLRFAMDDSIKQGVLGGRPSAQYLAANPPSPNDERGPNIFTAVEEQLGLKLERTKGPREYFVIDSAERPSGFLF
jgi:uncharacterized protein (TIGR03435 family)